MRMICGMVFLAGALSMVTPGAWGQSSYATAPQLLPQPRFTLAVIANSTYANTVSGYEFWMVGGTFQADMRIARHLAIAGDVSELHTGNVQVAGVGLDLLTAVAGPRLTFNTPEGRFHYYGQAMGGEAYGSNSLFPNSQGATSTAHGVAMLLGGGTDLSVARHFSVRLADIDWLRSELSNGTTTVQNNLRLGSGVVLRF